MLTMNYFALSNRLSKPVGNNKTVRKNKDWAWDKKHSAPGRCVVVKFQKKEGARA